MKNIIYTAIILFVFSLGANAQCYLERHDTNINTSWESCTANTNPNPARGSGHWIMYDLGTTYELGQFHFWNYNFPGETNKGMQDIRVDFSLNGTSWAGNIAHTITEAEGSSFYEGEPGPQLNGASARYVLITAINNYGSATCTGLAEVKIGLYVDPCNTLVMNVDDIPIVNGQYHATDELNSEGLVNTTGDVLFKAEESINLEGGFQTKEGALFEAYIEDCPE